MTAAMGPDRFSTALPLVLQKSIFRLLSYGDAKDAQVSQLFKKLMDDPFLWKALGEKMNFKIDLKTAKEDFIRQYDGPVFDLILDKLPSYEKESIKKLPFLEQRAALEQLIASQDKDSKLFHFINEVLQQQEKKQENTPWRAACFILRNNRSFDTNYWRDSIFLASKYHLNIFKAFLECKRNRNESLSAIYFDHMKIMHFTHLECVPVLLEMGVAPNHSHLARAIVEIACEKGEDTGYMHSAQERLQPILDYFKDNQQASKEAMGLADNLIAELKKIDKKLYLTAVHTMSKVYKKSQEAKESLQKQVLAFIEANFNKK